jgi:formylglycine-generating enzyme required for sulfatase activity
MPVENNEPLVKSSEGTPWGFDKTSAQNYFRRCTFSASAAPMGEAREDFPLNCVDWAAARAFCQFEGGDLPTEAQFEYAATKAGRPFQTRFPWGNQAEAPRCDQAVFSRWDSILTAAVASTICAAVGFGAVAVTEPIAQKDATRLGVMGLGGNLVEWALDGFEAFDSPCWKGASLRNPVCREESGPERTIRGSGWKGSPEYLPCWHRDFQGPLGSIDLTRDVGIGKDGTGFRCAYDKEPE